MNSRELQFITELRTEVQQGFVKQVADKILQGMNSLENAADDVKRRWIWELLQNAKDIPNRWGEVSVRIILKDNKLIFKHNGDPFTVKNITSLIQQVSSKEDTNQDGEVTGRFGTGFITTHLLSKKFTVRGIAKTTNGVCKRFELLVDRDADCAKDMMVHINDAIDLLYNLPVTSETVEDYEEIRTENDFDTEFEYPLQGEGLKSAEIGIGDLINVLPYTLLFITKIKTVIVTTKDGDTTYTRDHSVQNVPQQLIKIIIQEKTRKNEQSFLLSRLNETSIALPISNNAAESKLERIGSTIPKIFCSFPLIGSQDFVLPFVINNYKFNPTEPRDGIYLKQNTVKANQNKDILERSIKLFGDSLNFAIQNRFSNFYHLFVKMETNDQRTIDMVWLKGRIIDPLHNMMWNIPIARTKNGVVCLNHFIVPGGETKEDRKKLYDILIGFTQNLALPNEIEDWYKVLEGTPAIVEIEGLLERVKKSTYLGSVEVGGLAKLIQSNDTITWINKLIKFVSSIDTRMFFRFAIIPNEEGIFKPVNVLVRATDEIPDEFKSILCGLTNKEKNYKSIIIHPEIKMKIDEYHVVSLQKVVNEINQAFREKQKTLGAKLAAAKRLMAICSDSTKESRMEMYNMVNNFVPFGPELPMTTMNLELPSNTWDECDKFMTLHIINIIELTRDHDIYSLATDLKIESSNVVPLLNEFFQFIIDRNLMLKDYERRLLFPSSVGKLRELGNLRYPEKLAPEIIDLFGCVGQFITNQLFDRRMTTYKSHRVFNLWEVNKKLIEFYPNTEEKVHNKARIVFSDDQLMVLSLSIISLACRECPNENDNKYFDFFKTIYPNINRVYIDKSANKVNKDCALKFLIGKAIKLIHLKSDLAEFRSVLPQNVDPIKWISNLIEIVNLFNDSNFINQIKISNIFLNMHQQFTSWSMVKSVKGEIDEKFFEIANLPFIGHDWKNELIDPRMTDVLMKMSMSTPIDAKTIMNEVDGKISSYAGDKQDPGFSTLILRLYGISDILTKELCPYFYDNKQALLVGSINDPQVISNIANLLTGGMLKNESVEKMQRVNEFLNDDKKMDALNKFQEMSPQSQDFLSRNLSSIKSVVESPKVLSIIREESTMTAVRTFASFSTNDQALIQNHFNDLRAFIRSRSSTPAPEILTPTLSIPDGYRPPIRHYTVRRTNTNYTPYVPPPPPPVYVPYLDRVKNVIQALLRNEFPDAKFAKATNQLFELIDGNVNYKLEVMVPDSKENLVITESQVQVAMSLKEGYGICVIPKEVNNVSIDSIHERFRVIINFGDEIEKLNDTVSEVRENFKEDSITLDFETMKYIIKEKYWEKCKQTIKDWAETAKSATT